MDCPSQCDLEEGQIVLLCSILNNLQSVECTLLEVALTVHGANTVGLLAKATILGDDVGGLDLAREETTCKGVVDHNVDLVLATKRDELWFDSTS